MNVGMIMTSIPASADTNQKQTAVAKSDNENSFASIFGTAMSSPEAEIVEPVDTEIFSSEQLSFLNELIKELKSEGPDEGKEFKSDVTETGQLVVAELGNLQQQMDKSYFALDQEASQLEDTNQGSLQQLMDKSYLPLIQGASQLEDTNQGSLLQLIDQSNSDLEFEENSFVYNSLNSVGLEERNLIMMMNRLNEKIAANEEIDLTEILPIFDYFSKYG